MSDRAATQTQTTAALVAKPAPSGILQRKCDCGQHTVAGGECEECKKRRESGVLQRAAASRDPVDSVPPIVHDVLRSPGQPLDSATRAFMEPRFGHDFSGVHVHAHMHAAQSPAEMSARAYTFGQNIVFGAGQLASETSEGQKARPTPITADHDEELTTFPHHRAIARAFGMQDFKAPATLDPSVRRLGAEAVTQNGHVRFDQWPSLEVAAHEAAHVVQSRRTGRRTDVAGADRHAAAVASRVTRGLGAADLLSPSALVSVATPVPLYFVPAGAGPATHTVAVGETLRRIARDVYGAERYANAIHLANPGVVTLSGGVYHVAVGAVLTLPDRPDPADPWVNPYVSALLRNGGAWTRAQAEATLLAFAAESPSVRDTMVAHYLPFNNIPRMLSTLPANSTQAGGAFEHQARDLLQRIQRVGAQADARSQALTSENAMAQAQVNEMIARNRAAARAALGGGTPTTAQVAAQQANQAAQGSIARQTATMRSTRGPVRSPAPICCTRLKAVCTATVAPGMICWSRRPNTYRSISSSRSAWSHMRCAAMSRASCSNVSALGSWRTGGAASSIPIT
jgi:hypothetical protein